MRIYCLSKVEEISPEENIIENIEPYEDGADEILINLLEEHETPKRIKKYIGHSQFYGLTEISVGYLEIQNRKIFAMYIYRKEFGIHKIRMIRGAIRFEKISDDIFDLYIANTKLYPSLLNFDLRYRIRCVKNTSTKGIITEEEEELYYNYEKQIKEFCDLMPDLQEDAFNELEFAGHNTSAPKVFTERINNFAALIKFCCDPQTGRYRNVPTSNTRLYQKVENFLDQKSIWNVRKPREQALDNQAKNFRDCSFIKWLKADLNNLTLKDVNTKKLEKLHFEEVNFFTSTNEIQPCLTHFDFTNLETLSLWHCQIKELTKEFFEMLPETLLKLDVRKNNITEISDTISKLKNLDELNLFKNLNLSDSGIPWGKLPTKITDFNLGFTNITKIPAEIGRLTSLVTLNVSSEILTFVEWTFINPTIEWLHIEGGGKMNDIDLSGKNCLQRVDISKAGLVTVDCSLLPSCLETLILCKNKLQHFDPGTYLPNLDQLILSDNNLESIEWKNIPSSVNYITLDNNQLTTIENISHLTNLLDFTVNSNQINYISTDIQFLRRLILFEASGNQISELPIGFEKLKKLKSLNLCKNQFNCNEKDLVIGLWQRLPRQNYFEVIYLNNNNLGELPCMLKEVPIENLHVEGCGIKYICPKLYSDDKNLENCPHLNIRFNPIQYLPYIPQTIFQPPLKQPPVDSLYPLGSYEPPRFHLRMEDERFVVTSKFPMSSKKPKYDFETLEAKITKDKKMREPNFRCNCCAKCGAQNEEYLIIEQLMVMDYALTFDLVVNEKPRIIAGKKKKKEVLNVENKSIVTTKQKVYCPGKWKTNVITRLCEDCIILMKSEINKAFEESKKVQPTEDSVSEKRMKEAKTGTSETLVEPKNTLYNTNLNTMNNVIKTSGLLLSNQFSVDCFLNAAVNAIATMETFKTSICSTVEFSEHNSPHRKLVEILQHQIPHVRSLRETLPSFYGNLQEDAGDAFFQLINSIDSESKKLINFSYKTAIECSCRTTIRECNDCAILNLTVTPNCENTFSSLLEQWQFQQNIRCSNCYKMSTMKHFVEIGIEQEYLVIEINSRIVLQNNETLQISISKKDFYPQMQEIFDNFWELIGAIQYTGTGEVGHYLSWKKCDNGKWMVINDDKQRVEEGLLPDLKDYKILIFKKIEPFDIDLSDLTVDESDGNIYVESEQSSFYQNTYAHEMPVKSISSFLPPLRNITYSNPNCEQLSAIVHDTFVSEDVSSNFSGFINNEIISLEEPNQYQQPTQTFDDPINESLQQNYYSYLENDYYNIFPHQPEMQDSNLQQHQYISPNGDDVIGNPQTLPPIQDPNILTQNFNTLNTFNYPTTDERQSYYSNENGEWRKQN